MSTIGDFNIVFGVFGTLCTSATRFIIHLVLHSTRLKFNGKSDDGER